jgi:hypothetical protein
MARLGPIIVKFDLEAQAALERLEASISALNAKIDALGLLPATTTAPSSPGSTPSEQPAASPPSPRPDERR